MYGNYDEQDKLPEFDLYNGVNIWDKVKFDNESHIVIKEIIHVSLMDHINVSLKYWLRNSLHISTRAEAFS